jgi:hypothetical protein
MIVDRPRAGLNPAARAAAWAAASGTTGVVAGVLLVLFYVTAKPWRSSPDSGGWFGIANDYLVIAQFCALVPVEWRLGRLMARDARARVWTRVGLAAAMVIIGAQVLLVAGVVPFEALVPAVSVGVVVTLLWSSAISRAGRRTRTLPERVTRFGRLLERGLVVALVAFPIGALVTAAADVPPAWVIGALPGFAVWLLFPVWVLMLVPALWLTGGG